MVVCCVLCDGILCAYVTVYCVYYVMVKLYEDQKAEMKGMWMLSFSSEFELGQFEQALATRWKEMYQARNWIMAGYTHLILCPHRWTSSSPRCWILLSRQERSVLWNCSSLLVVTVLLVDARSSFPDHLPAVLLYTHTHTHRFTLTEEGRVSVIPTR